MFISFTQLCGRVLSDFSSYGVEHNSVSLVQRWFMVLLWGSLMQRVYGRHVLIQKWSNKLECVCFLQLWHMVICSRHFFIVTVSFLHGWHLVISSRSFVLYHMQRRKMVVCQRRK